MENIKLFINDLLKQIPQEECYPLVVKFNAIQTPPLKEDELMELFNCIATFYKEELELQKTTEYEKEIAKEYGTNKRKATFALATYLAKRWKIITVGEKEREMYVYKEGMYHRAENEIIFPEIQRILCERIEKSAKMETFHKIADMTSHPRSIFESAPLNLIPLKNGVYDTDKKILISHSPDYHFTYQFPIIYDPTKKCEITNTFFDQLFDKENKEIIQEWLGYYFYRLYSFKKAIIFVGEGNTGKTTLLEVIINLIGKGNISSISLHKMSGDKFSASNLYGKHGNLVDELSARDITDTGMFKVATGGGSISGEYKFGNQFSFYNFSKLTFACNKIPDISDFDDLAYFSRWIIIRFEKIIENKIPNFIQTLATEEERSGLFNYAIEGLERLLKQGHFSHAKDAIDTKNEMMLSGSSVAMFCAKCLKQEVGVEITKEDMYKEYTNFCIETGIATETIKMFGTKFLFYVGYASEGLVADYKNGKPVRSRGWRNVTLIKEEPPIADDF